MEIIYPEETYNVIGAALAVHNELGCGFREQAYQEALAIELEEQDIPFEREKEFRIEYHGHELACTFRPDFVCYNKIILELKAVSNVTAEHESQVLNYLKATGCKLGILINFGQERLFYKRYPNFFTK